MTRVAVLVPTLAPGGAERASLQIAGELVRRGHDVDLLVAHDGLGAESLPLPDGVRSLTLARSRTAASVPALARHLRRTRPAALLAAVTHANVAAVLAARLARCGTRVVVVEHTDLLHGLSLRENRRARLMPLMARLAYPRASARVAVSTGVADALVQAAGVPRASIQVLPNPIDAARLRRLAREPVTDAWWHADTGPVVLGLGRLVADKDFPTLIRAFAHVRRGRPCRLAIIGEGGERPRLERTIAELGLEPDARLLGYRANPYPYIAAAGALVLSSTSEGLPTALIEGALLDVPVVATDCGRGVREILEAADGGRLVRPRDVEGMAAAIAEALDGSVPSGGDALAERFDVRAVVDAYEKLLLGAEPARADADFSTTGRIVTPIAAG